MKKKFIDIVSKDNNMKYKLINSKTNEKHLCDKVTIDGFDYYVSDEEINNGCWILSDKSIAPIFLDGGDLYPEMLDLIQWRKVIATNNPNIDIPKVVGEVEAICIKDLQDFYGTNFDLTEKKGTYLSGFKTGYNKSQETFPFSLDDVKEIINLAREQYWDVDNRGFSSNTEGDWSFKYSTKDEIIQKYQETKVLTIFYK